MVLICCYFSAFPFFISSWERKKSSLLKITNGYCCDIATHIHTMLWWHCHTCMYHAVVTVPHMCIPCCCDIVTHVYTLLLWHYHTCIYYAVVTCHTCMYHAVVTLFCCLLLFSSPSHSWIVPFLFSGHFSSSLLSDCDRQNGTHLSLCGLFLPWCPLAPWVFLHVSWFCVSLELTNTSLCVRIIFLYSVFCDRLLGLISILGCSK